MSRTDFNTLLEAGAHFGHLKRKWNPKMAPYIFMEKNGILFMGTFHPAALLRQIKPLVVADLKSRLLPARISVSLSADNARRSVAQQLAGEHVAAEFDLGKAVLLIPINYILDLNAP